ncbi:DUF4861 family protein [Rhizosphaericola mali]|uniref:DUF4861 domain-containing protein n=1 Tax=Rhizosphaericola mali TaxID=2545455 RepID=A0A5P2G1V3_9BACT|nr:DUF4861 family protein [Rhizosphaericola mali]QES87812.1 DUF4861 domain-containing protein [Rhizosphaericola mali]
MVRKYWSKITISAFILLCTNNNFAQSLSFSIKNNLDLARQNELVEIPMNQLQNKGWDISNLTRTDNFQILVDGKNIETQLLDKNLDGKYDAILFLTSLNSKELKHYQIISASNNSDNIIPKAHVRMKLKDDKDNFGPSVASLEMPFQNAPTDFSKAALPPYLTEGPAWENQKNAFRLYFDTRNTIDIYGKRIPGMVMDSVGANPAHSYHHLADWGMDILHVVKSLGAGSLAIQTKDLNGKDTLIRLGGKQIKHESYQQIADGPLYAELQMKYSWEVNNRPITITQNFSIWGEEYYYKSDVIIEGLPKGSVLFTGIGDFYDNEVNNFTTKNFAVTSSFGKQSENKDELGMAIGIPLNSFYKFLEAPKKYSDITETHLIGEKIIKSKQISYYFFSCWSKTDTNFLSENYFNNYLKKTFLKIEQPLLIHWEK